MRFGEARCTGEGRKGEDDLSGRGVVRCACVVWSNVSPSSLRRSVPLKNLLGTKVETPNDM